MGTAKRHVSIKVLTYVIKKPKGTPNDYPTQAMPNETYLRVWCELDILEVFGKLYGKSFPHCLDTVVCPTLIGTAYEDFGFESNLKAKFKNLEVLARSLVSMN